MERLKISPTNRAESEYARPDALVVFTALVVCVALLGPITLKSIGNLPQFDSASCAPGSEVIAVRFDGGTHFNILREKQPGLDWMPNFHLGRFRQNAHSLPDPNMIAWAEGLDPLTSMFYTLDYRSHVKVLVIAPTASLPAPNSFWQVCGEWEDDPSLEALNIFYAREKAALP